MDKLADGERRPLHRLISDELAREVALGQPAIGEALPSESELMVRFGVSRGTIRQALAALRADGTIAGGRGVPPIVRGPRLSQPFTELLSFSSWVRSLGRRPSGRVVEFTIRAASPETARALGLEIGARVRHLVRVRYADGEPLMIERTTFPGEIGDRVAGIDLEHDSIYAELATQGVVFDAAHQEIDAIGATAADARLLDVAPRTPLLRVRRLTYSPAGRPLEWSEDRYLSGRVTLAIHNSAARPAMARRLATTGGR
ncbi:MAG: GntR family transcriptional regulator [Chloroflexota bacterium]